MGEKISRSTYEAYFGIALAAIVGVFPMNWWLKTILMVIVCLISIDIAFRHPRTIQFHWATRMSLGVASVLLIVAIFYAPIRKQYIEDHAAALEGELCSFRSFWGTCYSPAMAIVEIGDSGSTFVYVGVSDSVDMGAFARNVGLHIERGTHGIEVTTPLLDRSGKKILTIDKNRWTVIPQPGIWDKNYTENALEVKDSRGDVVFQIRFLPDRIQIAAEWRDQFGHGQEWSKCSLIPGKPPSGCISPWGSPETELQNERVIEPIFLYPSKDHWGEFAK